MMAYHWNVEIVEIAPGFGFGQRKIDLFVSKRPLVPDVGQDALGLRAEATVVTAKERDSAGVVQGACGKHGC